MDKQTTIVEINGVKMEIDMRHAKVARVDTLRIGTRVRVLKKGYQDSFSVLCGVVVGFDQFEKLPSIRIAYVETGYSSDPLKFLTFNAKTDDMEILVDDDGDELAINRDTMVQTLTRAIEAKRVELQKAEDSLALFHKHFGRLMPQSAEVA